MVPEKYLYILYTVMKNQLKGIKKKKKLEKLIWKFRFLQKNLITAWTPLMVM